MNPTQFDIENAASLASAFIAVPIIFCTYIEASHSLTAGMIAGACGTIILLAVAALANRTTRNMK